MAKLSARGATVAAKFENESGDVQYAVRSDGVVLRKVRYTNGGWSGWSRYLKAAKGDAQAAIEGLKILGLRRIKA